MRPTVLLLILFGALYGPLRSQCAEPQHPLLIPPKLESKPLIDGDPAEWKSFAFESGSWDLARVKKCPGFDSTRNRLTYHPGESGEPDLKAIYYLAWDQKFLYFGAKVMDNVNDVTESKHAPKRWYYKDAIALFMEVPRDDKDETFGEGDHCFAFIADTTYPDYGSWWRHGTADSNYIEEPLAAKCEYKVKMMYPGENANYSLEAKIDLKKTFGTRKLGKEFDKPGGGVSIMIVHCDPDGGEYGGHLLIYGKDDHDNSWTPARFYPGSWKEFKEKNISK